MFLQRWTVALVACGVLNANAAASNVATAIPYTYVDNRIVIECTIDGHGPFAMILDTGTSTIVVTPEVAVKLSAAVHGAGTVTGAGNKVARRGLTSIASLSLGKLTLRNMSAEVIDLAEIRTKLHFPHLDGIIGYPILKQFATFVDADNSTVTFARTAPSVPPNATKTHFTGVLAEIRGSIEGIAGNLLVDTGDRSSLTLFGPFARHNDFFGRYPSKTNVVTGYGVGGPVHADVFTLPALDVFGKHLVNVVTRASRQTGGGFESDAYIASIGTGVLKRFNIVYDYPHNTIVAWPSKYFTTPDKFVPPEAAR